jgi:hypothetical protein
LQGEMPMVKESKFMKPLGVNTPGVVLETMSYMSHR